MHEVWQIFRKRCHQQNRCHRLVRRERDHAKDKIEKVSRTVGTGERNRLAPTGKRRHRTKMKRYGAHCKIILLGRALGRGSLQERQPGQPSNARCPLPTTKRGWSSHKTRTISQRKASVSVARSSLRLRMVQARAGEQPDEREQNKITQADSHNTGKYMRKEAVGTNRVLCWWPDALRPPTWMRLRKLLNWIKHPRAVHSPV